MRETDKIIESVYVLCEFGCLIAIEGIYQRTDTVYNKVTVDRWSYICTASKQASEPR